MAANCKCHTQIYNFLDNLIVHVIEAGRTKMAQVDAGTFVPADSRSVAERAIHDESAALRSDYAAGAIDAKTFLRSVSAMFVHPAVRKELDAAKPQQDLPMDDNDDGNGPGPEPEGAEPQVAEPQVVIDESEGS